MIRAAIKLFLLVVWIGVFYPFAYGAYKLRKLQWRDWLVKVCFQGILRICEIRLHLVSHLSPVRPLLLVSNHLSYMDIPILGSQAVLSFTPKMDIATWPFIGSVCSIMDCVFVERSADKIADAREAMRRALANNRVLSLFPEATTGNGLEVLPFRSSLFSLAEELIEGRELTVQPVAITYKTIRRLPIDRTQWPSIAWYGDMELLPHLWEFLQLGCIDVELAFLPAVTLHAHGDRKALAVHTQNAIVQHIEQSRKNKIPATQNMLLSALAYWFRSKS